MQTRLLKITDSSNIEKMAWSPDTGILIVRFKNGELYRYVGVPGDTVGLVGFSSSVGGAFNKLIVPNYKGVKIDQKNLHQVQEK